MKKTPAIRKKELQIFLMMYLAAVFLSHINILFFSSDLYYIDFFIALISTILILEKIEITPVKIFFLGLITDIFTGSTLGVYSLVFLLILSIHYFLMQFLIFKTILQKLILLSVMISIGIFIRFFTIFNTADEILIFPIIISLLITLVFAGGLMLIINFKKN